MENNRKKWLVTLVIVAFVFILGLALIFAKADHNSEKFTGNEQVTLGPEGKGIIEQGTITDDSLSQKGLQNNHKELVESFHLERVKVNDFAYEKKSDKSQLLLEQIHSEDILYHIPWSKGFLDICLINEQNDNGAVFYDIIAAYSVNSVNTQVVLLAEDNVYSNHGDITYAEFNNTLGYDGVKISITVGAAAREVFYFSFDEGKHSPVPVFRVSALETDEADLDKDGTKEIIGMQLGTCIYDHDEKGYFSYSTEEYAKENGLIYNKETGRYEMIDLAGQVLGSYSRIENGELKLDELLIEKEVDYSDCFDGINGCAVFYDMASGDYQLYNKELCEQPASPCSTFKIISCLMGLHNGILRSEETKMGYNGAIYPVDEWNDDLNLKQAFQSSCIWYFKKVIEKVGKEEVGKEIAQLGYGNCDISEWDGSSINPLPDLNGFWLESSLQIAPKEQVDILRKIFQGDTEYTYSEVQILKNVMLVSESGSAKIYGKTGSGINGNAWFVGYIQKDKKEYCFAVRLADSENGIISGTKAKDIALQIIQEYYLD